MQRQRPINAASIIFPHSPNVVTAAAYSVKVVLACARIRAWHHRPRAPVPMQSQSLRGAIADGPNIVASAAYSVKLVLPWANVRAWDLGPYAPVPVKRQRPINVGGDVVNS